MSTLEKYVTRHFSKLYGNNLASRVEKLNEEYEEFQFEALNYLNGNHNPAQKEKMIDELSDVYSVLIHIASILNTTSDELMEMALDKSVGRLVNPDYKRNI